jgi:predicted permease
VSAVFNIVLPVFGVILAGVLSRRSGLLGEDSAEALNRFVFFIALPPLLFLSCARVPLQQIFNWPFLATYAAGLFMTLAVGIAGALAFFNHRELPVLTIHGMALIFSNTVYLGIPLLVLAYGQDGAIPGVIITLFTNLVFLTLSAVLIESGRMEAGRSKLTLLSSSFKNPLIVAPVLGVLFSWSGLTLSVPLERFLELIGQGAGPTALFAMGMSLYGFSFTAGMKEISWIVVVKLLLHPLFTWLVGRYVFALDDFWLECAVILSALPAGALVFVVAQRYNVYVQRAAASVVVTTAISVVTLAVVFLWAAA